MNKCSDETGASRTLPLAAELSHTSVSPKRAKQRMVGLDLMRFIAVMMVLYTHANTFPTTRRFFMGKIGLLYDGLYQLRVGTWVAIDLFFVLSGFLISGLLFQELAKTGNISISRFLVRRGFKIYPVFWLMLLVTIFLRLSQGVPVSFRTLFTELSFVQNYLVGPWPTFTPGYWGITWSLGVEEHFYFMMAGLVFVLKKYCGADWGAKIRGLPKLFVFVAVGCLLARLITCIAYPYDPKHKHLFLFVTHARMDALFFGVLLSYYWHNRWSEAFKNKLMDKAWVLAAGAVALLSTAIYQDQMWFHVIGYVCTYLGSGYLLISLLSLDRSPCNMCIRAMAWLGRHSYSVYLWHMMAGYQLLPYITFKKYSMTCWSTNLFIYFIMCWAVGTIMSLAVEFPMLRIRDRFFPWLNEKRPVARAEASPAPQALAG